VTDEIVVELFIPEADTAEIDRTGLSLRQELLEIEQVRQVGAAPGGPAPPGARGVDLAAIGALAVTVQPTVEVLARVVGVLRSWLARRSSPGATSTMRLTVNGHSLELTPTSEQQAALVEEFIRQASTPSTGAAEGSPHPPGGGTGDT